MESPAVSATLVPANQVSATQVPATKPPAARVHENLPAAGKAASAPAARPRQLDLRGLEPPQQLGEARLEDLTIDGICGVY